MLNYVCLTAKLFAAPASWIHPPTMCFFKDFFYLSSLFQSIGRYVAGS